MSKPFLFECPECGCQWWWFGEIDLLVCSDCGYPDFDDEVVDDEWGEPYGLKEAGE